MTLYVIPVPAPAAGQDWKYTIPGQYVEDVVAVTATLATAVPVATFPDSSGNGNNAAVQSGSPDYVIGAAGPFAGGANNYAVSHPANQSPNNQAAGVTGTMSSTGPANFTLEAWVNRAAGGTVASDVMGLTNTALSGEFVALGIKNDNLDPFTGQLGINNGLAFTIPNFAARLAWHLLAITWDGTSWRFYRDGTLVQTTTSSAPTISGQQFRTHVAGNRFNGDVAGSVGASAIYPAALSAGQLAAHAAANSTAAAFQTAALADSPLGLWMLNQQSRGPSRTVLLEVTDGTRVVSDFPSGFVSGGAQAAYNYSWQSNLNSSTQTPDQTTTTVAIPNLVLPAGYTIGTRTLDLAAGDQWSNINVWWDDAAQRLDHGVDAFVYPPGARLVIVPQGAP